MSMKMEPRGTPAGPKTRMSATVAAATAPAMRVTTPKMPKKGPGMA
jgi:hypothetical protein